MKSSCAKKADNFCEKKIPGIAKTGIVNKNNCRKDAECYVI